MGRDPATLIPIVLASDKTVLSSLSGEASTWPVYMTIGNVVGYKRWHPRNRATRLIGLLPKVNSNIPRRPLANKQVYALMIIRLHQSKILNGGYFMMF